MCGNGRKIGIEKTTTRNRAGCALQTDLLAHPIAEIIVKLSGLNVCDLDEAERDSIAIDVGRLMGAAEGWMYPEAYEDQERVQAIRKHLHAAVVEAESLSPRALEIATPIDPAGRSIGENLRDCLDKMDGALGLVEAIAEGQAVHMPRKRSARKNLAAYQVARIARHIFQCRTGGPAIVKKQSDKAPASPYGHFVEDLFGILFNDPGTRPEWYSPAKAAVTMNSQNK